MGVFVAKLLLYSFRGHIPPVAYIGILAVLLIFGAARGGSYAYSSENIGFRSGRFKFALVLMLVLAGIFAILYGIGLGVKSGKLKLTPTTMASNTMSLSSPSTPWTDNTSNTSALAPTANTSIRTPIVSTVARGTSDSAFGKTWVDVNGERLTGISNVMPAAGYQVAVIYNDGGKSVPASALPQGFLDAWHITPATLQATNNQ